MTVGGGIDVRARQAPGGGDTLSGETQASSGTRVRPAEPELGKWGRTTQTETASRRGARGRVSCGATRQVEGNFS